MPNKQGKERLEHHSRQGSREEVNACAMLKRKIRWRDWEGGGQTPRTKLRHWVDKIKSGGTVGKSAFVPTLRGGRQ